MRLVLDTNTVVSGLIWRGNPGKLLDAARELNDRGLTVDDLFDGYAALADCFVPASIPATVLRDPDDDQVLACALAAGANLIVSGDEHLLALGSFREIPIVDSRAALSAILG